MRRFTQVIASGQARSLYLVRGRNTGRAAWHFILVDKVKMPLFERAVKTAFIELADYGRILRSGWGEEPPQSVVEGLKEEFS